MIEKVFPDHHEFIDTDFFEMNDLPIVMTEKDAIKCKFLKNPNCWYLKIEPVINEDFKTDLFKKYLKKIVIIPARIQSERLPEKPLRLISNKPMINWTFEAVLKTSADIVQVATDSKKIYDLFSKDNAVMTSSSHLSGTDRVYEAVSKIGLNDHDVIINVQGTNLLLIQRI